MPASPPRRGLTHPTLAVFVGLALVIVFGTVVVYTMRTLVAEKVARHWLAKQGVPAGLEIRSLSLTGFSGRLRLGDPVKPDLTVERFDVRYVLSGPWEGHAFNLRILSARLYRPHLRARYADGKFSLGGLDRMIREFSTGPKNAGPKPDVFVEDGSLALVTPGGVLNLHIDGTMKAGAVEQIRAHLDPLTLIFGDKRFRTAGGSLQLDAKRGRATAHASLPDTSFSYPGRSVQIAHATIAADLPEITASPEIVGAIHVRLSVRGIRGKTGIAQAEGGKFDATFGGKLDANVQRQALEGELSALGDLAAIGFSKTRARGVSTQFHLLKLIVAHDDHRLTASWGGHAGVQIAQLNDSGSHLSNVVGTTQIANGRLEVSTHVAFGASLLGQTSGRGGFEASTANSLAAKAPVLSGQATYLSAMSRALTAFTFEAPAWHLELSDQGIGIQLRAPLSLNTTAGAHVSVRGGANAFKNFRRLTGAGAIALNGEGLPRISADISDLAVSPSVTYADLRLDGEGDALFARGLKFQVTGHVQKVGPRFSFTLKGCAPMTAVELAFAPNPLMDFHGEVCPSPGPIVETGPSGWHAQGRILKASGKVATFAAQASAAEGAFDARGRSGALDSASLVLNHAALNDITVPERFFPLSASGQVDLARGVWDGNLVTSTPGGRPFGRIHIRHEVRTSTGRADIDASKLNFAPGVLEPSDLTPMAKFAKDAEGHAGFTGFFAWGPKGASSSGGKFVGRELRFQSPLGPVVGFDSDLNFTSLSPLVSAQDQRIAVHEVQALIPVTGLSVIFDLDKQTLTVDAATANFAQGHMRLEPLVAPLGANSKLNGVLVFDHVNVGQILATSSLADSVKMDAVVDARIPFEFGPSGLHILNGHLAAVGPGRISISRKALGGVAVSGTDTSKASDNGASFTQDLAYQAMDNLAFDELEATLSSLAGDKLGILFHIKGRHDPPQRRRATVALADVLSGHALRKPIDLPSDTKIDLTLDTTLNFGELVTALEDAWRASLGQDRDHTRSGPVQRPPEKVEVK
jgi:hypothetical protein